MPSAPMLSFRPFSGTRAPALAFLAMSAVWAAFAATVPVLKAQIGASDAQFGAIFMVASSGAIAAMWLAPMVDRWLGDWSLAACTAGMGLGFAAAVLADGVIGFGAAMLSVAAASGICDILMNSRVSEVEAREKRQLMSLHHALYSFGYAGVALSAGAAREAGLSAQAIFLAIALGLCLLALAMRAPHVHAPDPGTVLPQRRRGGLIWLGGAVVLAGLFAESSGEGWSALLIERELGGDAAQAALGPALLGLTMGIGRLFGHVLGRFFPDTVLIALACTGAAAGATLASLAATPGAAHVGFALMGLGVSLVVPLAMGLVGRSVSPVTRVAALAQVSAIGYGAFLIGPAILGGVAEIVSLSASFVVVAAVLLSTALITVPLLVRQVRSGKVEA